MSSPPQPPRIKAIIFDIGGVVVASPLFAINAYEKEHNLPFQYLNVAITAQGHNGAFQRFERNELDLYTFYRLFGEQLSDTPSNNRHYTAFCNARGIDLPTLPESVHVDGRSLFGQMMRHSLKIDPKMAHAIQTLRSSGKYKIAALTNNFAPPTTPSSSSSSSSSSSTDAKVPTLKEELHHLGLGEDQARVRAMFHLYIESAVVGMRKPDPNFYKYALARLDVTASETIFLDDIGHNLKAAKDLGIHTIRVNSNDSTDALKELQQLTGLKLLKHTEGVKL